MTLRTPVRRALAAGLFAALATATVVVGGGPAIAGPPPGEIRLAGSADAVPGSYLVVLKDSAVTVRGVPRAAATGGKARSLAHTYGGTLRQLYVSALSGFSARMSESAAKRLAADPAVAYVEQDQVVRLAATQTGATWAWTGSTSATCR